MAHADWTSKEVTDCWSPAILKGSHPRGPVWQAELRDDMRGPKDGTGVAGVTEEQFGQFMRQTFGKSNIKNHDVPVSRLTS